MWLLENVGGAFQGRRLWLRPGKRYLFGRTRAEPGQLVISDKTISRKHLTIEVDSVQEGDGRNYTSRSVVTIEDLNTKIGTVINGTQIRGQKFVLIQDRNEIKMGHMTDVFRITWFPVVFSFSFTSKEARGDPWARLRAELEQLDVKYTDSYDSAQTTHVVAKKRNTSKGLQALINGKYIVVESYVAAVVQASAAVPTPVGEGTPGVDDASPLERDFDAAWPNPLEYLPPRGDEPSDRPVATYAPDPRRRDIFDGYTFVFYDQKQYENLLGPIANGKGKALLHEVVPGQTEVDDFVRYVKGAAGEAGLGEFEDGSEGKGVVVVRHLPAKGDHVQWFARFAAAVALRLDHRLIDQREFLDAILAVEPGMLRRPLEVEAAPTPAAVAAVLDGNSSTSNTASRQVLAEEASAERLAQPSQAATRRARARRGLTSRFKGFDEDLDLDDELGAGSFAAAAAAAARGTSAEVSQGHNTDDNMFVSQNASSEEPEASEQPRTRGTRGAKRRGAPVDEDEDVMEDIAPTAAAVKRRRIEAGVEPVPARSTPDMDIDEEDGDASESPANAKGGKKKGKVAESSKKGKGRENEILDQARRNREAADAKRAAEERERLALEPDPDGIDADEIRRLTIVEEMSVREAPSAVRTREQDIADGRWDPRWNGRRNYKKFRRQGDPAGRPPRRVIVGLEPAKTKEYGLGDDYWLEGGEEQHQQQPQPQLQRGNSSRGSQGMPPTDDTNVSSIPVASTIGTASSASTRAKGKGKEVAHADADESSLSGALPRTRGIPATATTATSSSGARHSGLEAGDSGIVDLEIIPDTEPEDNAAQHDSDSEPEPAVLDSLPEPEPEPELDLPRTRAGKAASRAVATRQSQATQAAQARTLRQQQQHTQAQTQTRSTRATRGHPETQTDTVPSDLLTQDNVRGSATGRGKRTAPAPPAAGRESPAKRPRRGAGGASASSAAAPITLRDSDSDDEDDALKFKFRSRRR